MRARSILIGDQNTAWRLARSLRGQPGLICLEGAGWDGSMVAAAPSEIRRGKIGSDPLPVVEPGNLARWVGWVDYDGAWAFARYEGYWLEEQGAMWKHGDAPLPPTASPMEDPPARNIPQVRQRVSREDFEAAVARAQQYIAAGDIYQVNLSHRCDIEGLSEGLSDGGLFAVHERLRRLSPAPHLAWLDLDGRQVASSSPETFLDVKDGIVITKPIKGTRPRGANAEEDAAQRAALLACAKERAELVMITDLERNDLGRVARTGSVRVEKLCEVESFAQVHHLVSTVRAELAPEHRSLDDLFAATFPGGSITGAPKIRAMEIIRDLERGPRGLYTGAIGWIGENRSVFSIAIRTLVAEGGAASFHVGAGIVADSTPRREYDETLLKARGMIAALGAEIFVLPDRGFSG